MNDRIDILQQLREIAQHQNRAYYSLLYGYGFLTYEEMEMAIEAHEDRMEDWRIGYEFNKQMHSEEVIGYGL